MSTTTETKKNSVSVHNQPINLDNVFMITLLIITLFGHLSIFYKLID